MDSARFQSPRVYPQVQPWLGDDLELTDWGWVLQYKVRKPYRMEQAPAPASMLKVIRCYCTGSCARNICSCRQHCLGRTLACRYCKGLTCREVWWTWHRIVSLWTYFNYFYTLQLFRSWTIFKHTLLWKKVQWTMFKAETQNKVGKLEVYARLR